MEKFNKLSLPAVILIASIVLGGIFFASQVTKQRSIERQQQTKELKEQEAKQQAEQALNTCLADADTSYSNQWYRECKSQGKLTNRCISLHDMTFDEYAKEKNIPDGLSFAAFKDFLKEKDDCSCRLPLDNADRINKILQNDKDECFKRYSQK